MTTAEKRRTFRELHATGCFVIPNPWNIGTARALASMGFKALATTSAGECFTLGVADAVDAMDVPTVLSRVRAIVDATPLPVSADFQAGYGIAPDEIADNVRRCLETGVAGLSIEDASGDPHDPLLDIELAADRIRAAREAIRSVDENVVLTGRAECLIVGRPDMSDVVRRLSAYAEAGADCLYAPGLTTGEQIKAILDAADGTPVNVLMGRPGEFGVAALAEMGVRRISVGSALARVAWRAFLDAANDIARTGQFTSLGSAASFDELNALF